MRFSIFQNKPCNKNSNDKTNQMLVEIKGQPIEIGNAPTPANKIDIGKLDWTDAKFDKNLNGIDFSKITAEELKKILDETVNHSNCPLGSFYVSSKGCFSFKNFGIVPQTQNSIDIDAIFNQPLPSVSMENLVKNPEGDGEGSVLYIDPTKILQVNPKENKKENPDEGSMNMHRYIMSRGNPAGGNILINEIDEGEIPRIVSTLEKNVLQPSTDFFPTNFMLNLTSPKVTKIIQSAINNEGFSEWFKNLQLDLGDIRRSLQKNISHSTGDPVIIHPRTVKETVPIKLSLRLPGKIVKSPEELKIEGKTIPFKLVMKGPEDSSTSSEISGSVEPLNILNHSRKILIDVDKLKVNMKGEGTKSSDTAGSFYPDMKLSVPLQKQSLSGSVNTPNGLHLEGDSLGSLKTSSSLQPFNIEIPLEFLQKALQGSLDMPGISKLGFTLDGEKSRPSKTSGSVKTVNMKLPVGQMSLERFSPDLKLDGESSNSPGKSTFFKTVDIKLPFEFLKKSLAGSFIVPNSNKLGFILKTDGSGSSETSGSLKIPLESNHSSRKSSGNNPEAVVDSKPILNFVNPFKFLGTKIEGAAETQGTTTKDPAPKVLHGKKQAFFVHEIPLLGRKSADGDKTTTQTPTTEAETEATTIESTTRYRLFPKIAEAGKEILKTNKKVLSIFMPQIFSGRRSATPNSPNLKENINEIMNNVPRPEFVFQSVDGKTLADNLLDEDATTPAFVEHSKLLESEATSTDHLVDVMLHDDHKEAIESTYDQETTTSQNILEDE